MRTYYYADWDEPDHPVSNPPGHDWTDYAAGIVLVAFAVYLAAHIVAALLSALGAEGERLALGSPSESTARSAWGAGEPADADAHDG